MILFTMSRPRFISLLLISLPFPLFGQAYTLEQCIERARVENMAVQLAITSKELCSWEFRQAKDAFLPSLNVSNQHNASVGRALDPTTYQFVTSQTVYDMSAMIGGSVTLFSGLERVYQLKKAEVGLRSAELEVERVGHDLELEVMRLFLEILMDKEAVEIYENKVELLGKQADLIRQKVELQAATIGDLLNTQADLARSQVEYATALNELNLDKVALCELIKIENWEQFVVSSDGIWETMPQLWNVEELVTCARELPQVRQQEMAIEQARRDVQIASAAYSPTLRINVGYGSTFSNARFKAIGEKYFFQDQLRDNMSAYVSATLSIPILNSITVSHVVKAKKAAVRSSKLEYDRLLLSLDKEVKQAVIQINTAYEKYNLLTAEVRKAEEALRETEKKYDVGAVTYYDYHIAVGNLYQAKGELLRARYEYIYRMRVMLYYAGEPLC